jgi:hypothetical protein
VWIGNVSSVSLNKKKEGKKKERKTESNKQTVFMP